MNKKKLMLTSICAGVAISIGCIAYLSSDSPWTFPIGLFMVCAFGFSLFTGKVCFAKPKETVDLFICLLFNILTAFGMGLVIRSCKPMLANKAIEIINAKLNEGVALIPLAILCNVMIFVAVASYKQETLPSVIRLFGLYFATAIFVICGFEHCVANAFYFALAGNISWSSAVYLAVNAIFNAVGGRLCHCFIKIGVW